MVDSEIIFRHVSATQTEQYQDCKRKWGFRYLNDLKTPPKPSAQAGTRTHEIIEGWLKYGYPPDEQEALQIENRTYYPGKIASRGLHMLPPPNPEHGTEISFTHGRWRGFIDLLPARSSWEDPAVPMIYDHKTSTDPKLWGKSAEDLKTDVQAIVYAKTVLDLTGASEVDLRWSYFQTREPHQARQSKVRLNVLEVNQAFQLWDDLAAEVQEVHSWKAKGLRAEHLPPTPTSCQKFGGCPYQNICPITPQEQLRGFMTQPMSMSEKFRALRDGAASPPPVVMPPAQAATVVPTVSPTDWEPAPGRPGYEYSPSTGIIRQGHRNMTLEDVEPVKALFLQGKKHGEIAALLGIFDSHIEGAIKAYSAEWVPLLNERRVNPPEEPKTLIASPDQQSAAPDDDTEAGDQFDEMSLDQLRVFIKDNALPVEPGRRKAKAVRELIRVAMQDREVAARLGEAAPVAQLSLPIVQPTPVPQVATTVAQPVVSVPVPQVAVPVPPAPLEAPTLATDRTLTRLQDLSVQDGLEPPTFTLFVDCLPRKTTRIVMSVREAFPEAFVYVERTSGVPDYRLVDFGKGPAMVATAIRHLQQQVPLGEDVIVAINSRTSEGTALLEVLADLADEVVFGA